MENNWILKKEDRRFGPVSLKTLKRWVMERRVLGSDMVSIDKGKTWSFAEKAPELIPFFPPGFAKIEETPIPRGYVSKLEQKRRSFEVMDMVPMIDTVFLLLIFFAVTSSFDIQSGIKVKLPAAATSTEEIKTKHTISITSDNLLFLNDAEINIKDLPKELGKVISKDEEHTVVIKADEVVQHGLVVKIMDIANKAGAKKLIVGAKKVEE